jgi:hypothetical protein
MLSRTQASVRRESMTCLGKLYSLAYSEMCVHVWPRRPLADCAPLSENNEPAALEHFAWIPQAILHSVTYPEAKYDRCIAPALRC